MFVIQLSVCPIIYQNQILCIQNTKILVTGFSKLIGTINIKKIFKLFTVGDLLFNQVWYFKKKIKLKDQHFFFKIATCPLAIGVIKTVNHYQKFMKEKDCFFYLTNWSIERKIKVAENIQQILNQCKKLNDSAISMSNHLLKSDSTYTNY